MALPTETRGREVNNNQDEAAYRLTLGPEVNYNQDEAAYTDWHVDRKLIITKIVLTTKTCLSEVNYNQDFATYSTDCPVDWKLII